MGKLDAHKMGLDINGMVSLDSVEWSTTNQLPLQPPHLLLHWLSWFLCGRLQLSKTFPQLQREERQRIHRRGSDFHSCLQDIWL